MDQAQRTRDDVELLALQAKHAQSKGVMSALTGIEAGQRVRFALGAFGDQVEATVERATHAGTTSLIDVRFDDGVEGLAWTTPGLGGPRFVRMGWVRPSDIASVVVLADATDLDDEDEVAA